MKTKLNVNHNLFKKLSKRPPLWWRNLIADPEIYIDVRKDNHINVYHNGGSIMKLSGVSKIIGNIHFEYIPVEKNADYIHYQINEDGIEFKKLEVMPLKNFKKEQLERIKKRIKKFNDNSSEKGIQGDFVTKNNNKKRGDGFFIDTEFAYGKSRIDMVWVDIKMKKIFFVELKTIGDSRLYIPEGKNPHSDVEMIDDQLEKYNQFIKKNAENLKSYYNTVFQIKKKLGILPEFVKEETIHDYNVEEKPILLVGDCTRPWIKYNAPTLNEKLKNIAYGCFYQGKGTRTFYANKTDKYKTIF
jgi:hypothetical protein